MDPNIPLVNGSTVTYWGIGDIDDAFAHLMKCGAKEQSAPTNVGGEIWVATVEDPFGNTLGIIENPEFRAEV